MLGRRSRVTRAFTSFRRQKRKGKSLKRWKIKTVCSNKTEDLGQVLSIVSAVDLTVRYTHGKIGLLELEAKHLKEGSTNIDY